MDKNEIYKIMNYKIMLEVFSIAYYIYSTSVQNFYVW